MEQLLQWVDALGTPVLGVVAYLIWKIKTNDLPHIESQLAELRGRLERE